MEINVNITKNVLIVSPVGELDHHTAKEVKTLIEEVIKNRGVKNLVFDFSRLSFMDSSGIGVIVGRYKLVSSLGGQVAISSPAGSIRKLLHMSGIEKIIASYESTDDALKSFEEGII